MNAPAQRLPDLAVVGAGPKAACLAAKVHVLNTLKLADLRLCIFERNEPASSWTGSSGFTTGEEELGTRPEKDVGFPYQSLAYGERNAEVDQAMLAFSWQAYLVVQGGYRKWIDAGTPSPAHREFAAYLAWVFTRATRGVTVRQAHVSGAEPTAAGWRISSEHEGRQAPPITSGGLVLTGTGRPRELPVAPEVADRVLSAGGARGRVQELSLGRAPSIAIVGVGESAASMALYLISLFGSALDLTIIGASLPSSRAESFLENSVYSDPHTVRWERLPDSAREDFIARTDRGVMSPGALTRLSRHRNLRFVVGEVTALKRSSRGRVEAIVDQRDEVLRLEFDAVANCVGFCPIATLTSVFGGSRRSAEQLLGRPLSDSRAIARDLDPSFALRGLASRLHLPGLAALRYGPGFANLSCLGTLSDRVLAPYCGTTSTRSRALAQEVS